MRRRRSVTVAARLDAPSSTAAGSDVRWLELLDRFVDSLCAPAEIKVGLTRIRIDEVTEAVTRIRSRAVTDLHTRWANVAVITAQDTWSHKGVEYDAVVVDAEGMAPSQLYLAASRAAHELAVVRDARPVSPGSC